MNETTRKYIKELTEWFGSNQNILLVCHTNPDGDAIGSMLGMYFHLKALGKECMMVSPSPLQEFLKWLDGSSQIIVASDEPGRAAEVTRRADLIVLLDFNHLSRLGDMEETIKASGRPTILVDHHPDPSIAADLVISEPGYSSTAELVFDLAKLQGGSNLFDRSFMEAVYTGMMTDTGNFSFGKYDGNTLRIVAGMLENGLRRDYITSKVYDNFSAGRMRLMGYALSEKMVVMPELNTAYIALSLDELARFNHVVGDTEGFVNLPLSIEGIRFSVLFLEKDDHVKLSLRSRGSFDVNSVARLYFNGGGHTNAAGGRDKLPLERAVERFREIAGKLMDELTAGDEQT